MILRHKKVKLLNGSIAPTANGSPAEALEMRDVHANGILLRRRTKLLRGNDDG